MSSLPFSAVVGADDAKLALLLAGVDPAIGGVLLRGEKGSAKTTLARGLAALLSEGAPFVDLPVGATEDRVIGSIDLGAALTEATVRFRPGLLAAAHGGVLYVDEVNLLPDHLVDVLLDVAATGINRVEREGVAHRHDARFVLVGSMNPEEGELRPQLLDRFGLCVDVRAPAEPGDRAEAVRRRLAADEGGTSPEWTSADVELAGRVAAARAAAAPALPLELVEAVGTLCVSVGAEGLRADLVICRAATALARLEGRDAVAAPDVRRVAPFALAHRARRHPLDPHGMEPGDLEQALDDALDRPFEDQTEGGGPVPDRVATPGPPTTVAKVEPPGARRGAAPGRRAVVEGDRGRLVTDRAPGPGGPASVAVGATVREATVRRAITGPDAPLVTRDDLREAVRHSRAGNLVIFAVDASGSMGAERRMEATKAAVLGLLVDAYQRRDRVAVVTFRDEGAEVVLRPTGSVEVAQARMVGLPTGGRTPLAAGILAAADLAGAAGAYPPLLVLLTDGRATAAPVGQEPVAAARAAAEVVRRRRIPSVVVDVEDGPTRLGLASDVAGAMGARLVTLADLTGERLIAAVRAAATVPGRADR